ncbi:Calcium-activated potassium channel subunit alpha-1 [Phytophthora citrophthora]|uniref:BK channel n=1 Tax=Phytophthora citrophthora TaxID=4793 RepID=A0AAD9GKK5_9STRA|nr:Calcium-activated potassium channel subunit alpha-1 [Phytophthora citrophthora]
MKLKFSKFGTAWEIFQTLFALLVSAGYVVQTYMPLDSRIPTFDTTALVVFAADYFLNLYCCENRWQFIISVNGVMDALTIFPALIDQFGKGHSKSLPFIRFVRVMRMLRLIRVVRVAGSQTVSAVQKQVYTIILLTTCLIFVAAGIFHAVESDESAQPDLQFGEALYFIVVTIATVGYGDIVPVTSGGRAVALGVIIVSFTIIPTEISRLTHLMALQSHFRTTYHPSVGKPHVLVVGHVMEPRCLLNFFREFYHPDRALGAMNALAGAAGAHDIDPSVVELPCVIVGPKEPTEEIINLLDHPVLQNRVTYIKGSVMSEEDMCRVGADAARACFVLASKAAANTEQTDAETVMRLLAIRNYNPDLPVYTQIVSPVFLDYISGVDADQLLCLDQIKISLLAKSCLCPGLVTLISNLFRSSSLVNHQILTNWEQEYAEGMALEVYATTLPAVFHGLNFSQACELLYNISYGEVILLAVYEQPSVTGTLKTPRRGSKKAQKLRRCSWTHQVEHPAQMLSNPGSSVIMRSGQLVYVMSESKKLTLTTSISNELKAWLAKGNVLPTRGSRANSMPNHSPPKQVNSRQQSIAEPESRAVEEMLLEETKDPATGESIRDHIIVVSDLDITSTVAFAQMLRLERHVPGTSDYHPIIFLSWSSAKSATAACRALREFEDIFVMLATGDSKRELLRANILDASRCVVLADKANIQDVDGEAVDSQTIFHYLAVLSIQAEYGMDTTSGLMPMVELNMPRTMQILDSTLKKRTATSYQHRQQLDSLVNATASVSVVVPREISRVQEHGIPDDISDLKRKLGRSVVKNIYLRGADNIITLDQQVKLSKRINSKRTLIRRELESSRRHYFDVRRSALLPFFAAGYGFTDDIFDNMLCQSFFTPGLIRLIYELLFSENGRPAALSGDDKVLSSCTASSIVQIPVPQKFVQRTFGELFLHLLSTKEIVAIGLYRGTDTPFQLPYVATGPDSDTILVEDDLVFVLAHPDTLDSSKHAFLSTKRGNSQTSSHNHVKVYEKENISTPSAANPPQIPLPLLAVNSKGTAPYRANINR